MIFRIGFTSVLGSEYLDDLEKLLFFNPQQNKTLTGINESIADYGVPNIYVDQGRLRIRLENLPGSQTVFALEDSSQNPTLVGVMIYSRIDLENIVLLHIAVREEYSRFGARADVGLVNRMMAQMRSIAKKLSGVRSIHLKYAKGLVFPV
jgi:hypothetical protein